MVIIQTIVYGVLGSLTFGTFNYYLSMKVMEMHNKKLEQMRIDFSEKCKNNSKI
jgi:hypothetical protein